eukprot:15190506-Ditylum_brightwellii.AAC.1
MIVDPQAAGLKCAAKTFCCVVAFSLPWVEDAMDGRVVPTDITQAIARNPRKLYRKVKQMLGKAPPLGVLDTLQNDLFATMDETALNRKYLEWVQG